VQGGEGDYSLETTAIIDQGIVQGVQYRIRYRAINLIGESDWSDIAYITAATAPDSPPAPTYSAVDST